MSPARETAAPTGRAIDTHGPDFADMSSGRPTALGAKAVGSRTAWAATEFEVWSEQPRLRTKVRGADCPHGLARNITDCCRLGHVAGAAARSVANRAAGFAMRPKLP